MPLPWKKVKGTKISQLFSDHLESQRRQRGHLVVETGFSTSLVDLFVKNRDRLKKPNSSSKKKKKKKKDQINDDSSLLVFTSPSPSSSPLIPRAPCSSPFLCNQSLSSSPLPQAAAAAAAAVDGELKETDERPNAKGVLGALLGMFFVVVIALWTKRFAVGLTMSALLMFFVEFIRKKTYRFLEPRSGVKRRLRLLMESTFQVITISFFFRRNESFDEKFNEEEEEEEKLGSQGNSNCEIVQIASEPMLTVDGCNQEPPLLALPSLDISESKKKGKRAKMKSKIKRLFKGGSSSKKEKRNHLKIEERIVPVLEEEKDPNQNEEKSISRTNTSKSSSSSSSSSLTSITTTQEDEISTISSKDEENSDGIVTGDEEIDWRGKRRMVTITIIMCVIVLVGLTIGGKFLAMAFMVFWFSMLKSGEILRRYIHTYI